MNNGFAIYETKIGYIKIGYTDEKIVFLKKLDPKEKDMGNKTMLTDKVYKQILEYLDGKRKSFDFHYEMHGTEFQKKCGLLSVKYLMAKQIRTKV